MEFFNVWKSRGGLIGVNRLSLGELIGANFMVLMIYLFIMMLLVQILPILLMILYGLILLTGFVDEDNYNSEYDIKQLQIVNVLSLISVTYFLIDFHLGWLSFDLFSYAMSKETFDSFATFNVSMGIINILLFFFGKEIFKRASTNLAKVGILLVLIYFGIKLTKPISNSFITNVVTQYDSVELRKERAEMKLYREQNHVSDEQRELRNEEQRLKDEKKEQEMRDFDKEYAKKYLK